MSIEALRKRLHASTERHLAPVTDGLMRIGLRPNQVTAIGTLVTLGAPALIVADRLAWAGVVWLFGSAFDLLDGSLARRQGAVSGGGAFLDSTLDRISEGMLFAAIAFHFARLGQPLDAALSVLALLGAFMISYTRARAEGLGAECKVGIITRAERVVLLGFGLCFGLLQPAVYLLIALTAVTVAQRVRHVLGALR